MSHISGAGSMIPVRLPDRFSCMRPILIVLACMAACGANADDPSGLSGTYEYVAERSADVSQAIDKAVEKMNFIKRPIARSRLAKTNTPYRRIRIEHGTGDVEITYDDRKPLRLPLDGRPVKWTRDDGEVFDVSAKLDGGKLLQTYRAPDGTRVNSFTKDAGGSLHLEVEVSSPQLPQPVKYQLVYRPGT
ncbi:MAG: hypothetical protein SXG53_14690 [Pseudomonadota bacterium]|nr:hypothetical protein [Pseudomonadota bacterium]